MSSKRIAEWLHAVRPDHMRWLPLGVAAGVIAAGATFAVQQGGSDSILQARALESNTRFDAVPVASVKPAAEPPAARAKIKPDTTSSESVGAQPITSGGEVSSHGVVIPPEAFAPDEDGAPVRLTLLASQADSNERQSMSEILKGSLRRWRERREVPNVAAGARVSAEDTITPIPSATFTPEPELTDTATITATPVETGTALSTVTPLGATATPDASADTATSVPSPTNTVTTEPGEAPTSTTGTPVPATSTATPTVPPPTNTPTNTKTPQPPSTTPAPPTSTATSTAGIAKATKTPTVAPTMGIPEDETVVTVGTAASTHTPTPTSTRTSTPVPPTATRTNTPVAPTPTRTSTPTPTRTPTPTPTRTNTPVAPTPTRTNTAVPPTPTRTNTPVPPTPTRTNTPVAGGGTRDKYLQPFSSTSPWNHPIGNSAQYVDANLPRTNFFQETELVYLDPNAPLRPLKNNGQWPATCGGGTTQGEVRIPNGVLIEEGSDSYMPNNAAGALRADNNTVQEFLYASRCNGLGEVYTGLPLCSHSIYGSGVGPYCAHGGSGLSAVGGSLRLWEITSTQPIKHALKITMPSYLLSNCSGAYRWPAQIADSGHDDPGSWQYYAGSNCNLRMGSLLAMPANANCDTLVSAALARRICKALQDYGAYIVDVHPSWDAGCQCPRTDWRPMTLNGEAGTEAPTEAVGSQLLTLFENLDVIANNSASNIGGGGTPRVPLSPPISN